MYKKGEILIKRISKHTTDKNLEDTIIKQLNFKKVDDDMSTEYDSYISPGAKRKFKQCSKIVTNDNNPFSAAPIVTSNLPVPSQLNNSYQKNSHVVDYVYKITKSYSKYDDLCESPQYDEFECKICKATFRGRPEYQLHMKNVHKLLVTPSHIYTCSICSKTFTKSYNLKRHEATHEKTIECRECDERFKLKKIWLDHMRSKHGVIDKQMICDICGQSYKHSRELKAHLDKHNGVKSFKCSLCEKSFFSLKSLKEHEKIHNPTIYECGICSAHLRSKKILKIHIRKHVGERNHHCLLCNKSFMTNCALVDHTRMHTNDRPFKCTVCASAFTTSNKLRSHSLIHSKSEKFTCEFCSKTFNFYTSYEKHKRHKHLETETKIVVAEFADQNVVAM